MNLFDLAQPQPGRKAITTWWVDYWVAKAKQRHPNKSGMELYEIARQTAIFDAEHRDLLQASSEVGIAEDETMEE